MIVFQGKLICWQVDHVFDLVQSFGTTNGIDEVSATSFGGCFELPFEGMGHWIGLNVTADHDLGFESCAINDSLTSFTFRSNCNIMEKLCSNEKVLKVCGLWCTMYDFHDSTDTLKF